MVRFLKVKFSFQSTPERIFPNILERRRQKLAERAHGTQRREGGVMPRERTPEGKAIRLTLHVGGVEQHISVQGGSFWQFWDKSYPLESGGSKARPVNTCKLDVLYGMMHNQRVSVSCLWVLLVNTKVKDR